MTATDRLIPENTDFSRSPEKDVFNWLDKHGIAHTTIEHAPTHRVEDSREVKTDIPGAHTKNLFMKDKSDRRVLVSAHAESELPLNRLHRKIDVQRLSFTKADQLWESLKVTPGSVSAFALFHDMPASIVFVVEKSLLDFDTLNFHPLRNDMTTSIARDDLFRFAQSTGHAIQIVDFSAL